MYTFSRPDSSGWKPAPSSSSDASRPRDAHLAGRRREDAGDALEQRRLARTVVPEDADRLALVDLAADVVQRLELDVTRPMQAQRPAP